MANTLKDYVYDDSFIERMNRAFSDLRADYELSMDADKEKVSELKAMHVDVKNQLSDLISYSSSSSGVISGLRGTGKTHLMLLARHEINENCFTGKANGFLNTNTIREELMSLMKLLNLKGMVLYIDEWEKISYNSELQRFLSFYIDRILDNPIYCWINIVPYRGSLYHLDRGADLQHLIDLDEN